MDNIMIIGAGGVGLSIGVSLQSQGYQVTYIVRGDTRYELMQAGALRTGIFGDIRFKSKEVHVAKTPAELPQGSVDLVIVSTKATVNEEIAEMLHRNRAVFSDSGRILIMQNGWGNDRPFLQYFEKDRIFMARVITGFRKPRPNISEITVHTAPILIGSLYECDTSSMEPIAAAICAAGIPAEMTDQLSEALWAKLLYNTTLNPLGAILKLPYGKLGDLEEGRAIMNRLIDETFSVMQAYGYHTFWNTPEEYREAFYSKLLPDTYAHFSSTLQDLEAHKKTEIRTLNGSIVRMAEEKGLSAPTHRMLCEMIHIIEEQF